MLFLQYIICFCLLITQKSCFMMTLDPMNGMNYLNRKHSKCIQLEGDTMLTANSAHSRDFIRFQLSIIYADEF